MTPSPKNHFVYLDSIRGLAALTVFSEHYVIAYGLPCESAQCKQWLDYSPLHIWWDGMAAVSMFFVLSGLVLSLKYFKDGSNPNLNTFSLSNYLLNRCIRIWLPYAIALCLSAILYWSLVLTPPPYSPLPASDWITQMWRAHTLSLNNIARELWLLKTPETLVLIPQAWTLSLELSISLMLPVALLLMIKGDRWLIFFSLFTICFLDVPIFLIHFLLGLFIAKYRQAIMAQLIPNPMLRHLGLLVGLGLYTSADTCYRLLDNTGIWLSSGLGAAMILMFILSSKRMQSLLSLPYLQQIGKISYSFYLLHMVVLMWLSPLFLAFFELINGTTIFLWLCGWITSLFCTVLFSLVFYYSIEKPCIQYGHQLSAWLSTRNIKANKGILTNT